MKAEFLALGHQLHVYDNNNREIGMIREKLLTLLPVFEIDIDGVNMGRVEKRFSLFRPKYDVDFKDWRVEGNFLGWDYDVYSGCSSVVHISKEPLHWGDTYVINIQNPADELAAMMLVIAIDAANCTDGN